MTRYHFSQVHISQMLAMPRIRSLWLETHSGREPTDQDIDRMYRDSLQAMIKALPTASKVIKGRLLQNTAGCVTVMTDF